MLSNLTNKNSNNIKLKRSLINAVCACASYKSNLPREAPARGMFEVSLPRWLRKIRTDSSSSPSEEGCMGAAAKASFHNRFKYH